jgi:hypothetical protein
VTDNCHGFDAESFEQVKKRYLQYRTKRLGHLGPVDLAVLGWFVELL